MGLKLVRIRQVITSKQAKRVYLFLAGLFLLSFLFNNLLLPWYVNVGGVVDVPSVVGRKYEEARRILDSVGLKPQKPDTVLDNEHGIGTILNQNPHGGARVKRGRRVYLTMSGGDVLVTVPNIKGRT